MLVGKAVRPVLSLVLIGACLAGCQEPPNEGKSSPVDRTVSVPATVPTPPPAASTVAVADEATRRQLVEGFYDVENGAWRWTGKHFAVDLGVPADARRNGATLLLKFTLTAPLVEDPRGVMISGKVGDYGFPPQKFSATGTFQMESAVPASAFQTDRVRAEFSLDRSFKPGGADIRELGIIAHSVALEPRRP